MKYSFSNKTFFAVAKDNVKDKIEVEIGDSKQVNKFYPQVKIMRWDNECNVSLRLKDDKVATENYEEKDGKIVWTKGNAKVEFYDLPESEDIPEGGFEFNIILKEKPDTNVIEFTLQTKGLDFFYQLEPTQKEKDEGTYMPDNVIGSYAIYASGNKVNYVGGKEYKCGKFGHNMRPRMVDSAGSEVWGELNIEKETMSITIPQDFLDKAVYPIKKAAGLEFGYHTAGGGSTYSTDVIIADVATSGVAGTADKIYCYSKYYTGYQGSVKCALITFYANPATVCGPITNGVTETKNHPSDTYDWYSWSYTGTKPTVDASTTYCIAFWEDNYTYYKYDTGMPASSGRTETEAFTTPWPTNAWSNDLTRHYSIYCEYTAAAAGPTGVKTINGTAIASVKTVNGTAIASVKTING